MSSQFSMTACQRQQCPSSEGSFQVVEACDLSLLGAPVNIPGILGTICEKREALEKITSNLEVLNPHQAFIYRRHFRQSVVNMPFHPFYLHLVLHILYIRLYYTHRLHTLFTLCFNYYLYFMCILRLHPCTNCSCTFQSHNLFNIVLLLSKQVYKVL